MKGDGFGIDVGGTTVKLGFFDREGHLLDKWEIPTDTSNNGSAILPDVAEAVKGYLAAHNLTAQDILGIGVGVPGSVRPDGVVNR